MNKRKGFLLYIILAILLALAILAFALNDFKRGAVTQLARNVDQNRLMLVAKSANAEVLATIRSQVNHSSQSNIFRKFREPFPDSNGNATPLNQEIHILSGFSPEKTVDMANDTGYSIKVESRASLTCYRAAPYKSVSAYNAYLDVYSKAFRSENPENAIEVYERHDVRLVDLRHTLDKYALFVKNYSPDLNNSQRRIVIQGIEPADNRISRVYLGNDNYPDGADPEKKLWLDVCFDEIKDMPGFKNIFRKNTLSKFLDGSGQPFLFYANQVKMRDHNYFDLPKDLFHHVPAVKKVYESLVNMAADSCAGQVSAAKVGAELKAKCSNAMPNTNNNAAVYRICKDYVDNFKTSTYEGRTVNDYSACVNFDTILQTCMDNWVYQYGYLDADKVWEVANSEWPSPPIAQNWVTALAYKGLTEKNDYNAGMGSYFYGYYLQKNSKIYNPERFRVGKMLRLYGQNNNTPVLVEGPVNLRFFKIGYFNNFEEELEFYGGQKHKIQPEPVPILFRRPDLNETFQNKEVNTDFTSNSDCFTDKMLMSQPIDSIPVNALLLDQSGNGPNYYNGDGVAKALNRNDVFSDLFEVPAQKTASAKIPGRRFGRLIDYKNVSYNYPSPSEFLADRVVAVGGKKTLCVDGIMYIEKGDMNLSDINYFYGKGLIYLASGNVIFGNFRRHPELAMYDSLRFYLRHGDFILGSNESDITIEASLAALNYKVGLNDPREQGSLVLGNKKKVHIIGNLIVDYLFTRDASGKGLSSGGSLIIEHDPIIMEPGVSLDGNSLSPYHVSIGRMKSAFAIRATQGDS